MKETHEENEKDILFNSSIKSDGSLIIKGDINESSIIPGYQPYQSNTKIKSNKFGFELYFLIFVFLLAFGIVIYYIHFYKNEIPNFTQPDREWKNPNINLRKYDNYLFNNDLEVMLIQDPEFDKDGGAIVLENGYLDNPSEEGLSTFITYLLSYLTFRDPYNIEILDDYYGNYKFGVEEYFMKFRFDILNSGFKRFLERFSSLLNIGDINNQNFEKVKNIIIEKIRQDNEEKAKNIDCRENHLLEYLVYGFKNKTNGEILPEGNPDVLDQTNITQITNYIEKLKNPSKIKIVIFSKYKFSLSSKYMKYYFKYLINTNKREESKENGENYEFNKSQIIYIRAKNYESNYIKIIFFIDKINNEDFYELFYKQNYFLYIKDFLEKKKNGSLYFSIKDRIKSINTYIEIILKSKIKFTIKIELMDLRNINEIIYATYQYIHKIVNEVDEKNIQLNRYKELWEICGNDQNLMENSFNTIELASENGKYLILTKYAQKYYFYYDCVPYNESIEYDNSILYNKTGPYLKQLRPKNSVIILAIRDKDKLNLTCNNNSKFDLDCDYFKNDENINTTYYYKVDYINITFNSTKLEKALNEDQDEFNINFEKNKYKSDYSVMCNETKEESDLINITFSNNNTLNRFYFKRSINVCTQKVLIKFHLYHPFLRPNNNNKTTKDCYYFLIMEMFSAIKRKINEELSDAISAKHNITFGQTENYLYISVFCFSDQAYKISEKIKNIIYDTDWASTDFFSNNEFYKKAAIDEFFVYDKNEIQGISRFYFKQLLKNNLFNAYEFNPNEFEEKYYKTCINNAKKDSIKDLSSFVIEGYIYGYFTKEEAKNLSNLFNYSNYNSIMEILEKVNILIFPNEYINWAKTIKILDNIEKIHANISGNIFNKSEVGNIGITYRAFDESDLEISILQNIVNSLKKDNSILISNEMLLYGNQYFELIFQNKTYKGTIPNDNLVKKEWEALLGKYSQLNREVDRIGTRYYYMIKNYIDLLNKEQASLYDRGLKEINLIDQKGTVLDTKEMQSEYGEKYGNGKLIEKNELESKIKYLKEKINWKKIDIFVDDI